MDGIMNKNQLTIVKEYEFDNPLIQKIDSIIDNSIRVVIINIFTHLIIFVNMIFNLQISLIMNQLISQYLKKAWVCTNETKKLTIACEKWFYI